MKYEEYKDSGMSWIGQVPTQWKRSRLKFLFSHSNAGVWGEEEKGDENDIACFRVADFDYQKGYLGFDKLTRRNITAKELEGRLLSQGSLLIEKSGGGDATPVGRVVRFNYEDKATCSNFVHFVTVDETHNSDFLYYYFYAMYANKENLLYFNQTTGIQNLKVGEYLGQSIFIPTFEEQLAIASYLDEKCDKINSAIDTQKKKIELLNELKQTIITNAVTRGLNPDAPMKDSGVEWIGKVPVHWDVCKIKNILQQGPDSIKIGPFGSSLTGKIGENLGYKVYGQWNIVGGDFNAGTNTVDSETFNALSKSYRVVSGDILVSMMGTIGKCAIIPENIQDGIMDSHVVKIRLDRSKMKTDFFEYFYDKDKSNVIYNQLQKVKGGSIMDGLNSSVIKNLTIATPPIGEQEEIVKYIKGRIQNIETQIFKTKRRIELLNELKQSIITEAVTGKIKVC